MGVLRVQASGCEKSAGSRFRVQAAGVGVQGLRFRAQCLQLFWCWVCGQMPCPKPQDG